MNNNLIEREQRLKESIIDIIKQEKLYSNSVYIRQALDGIKDQRELTNTEKELYEVVCKMASVVENIQDEYKESESNMQGTSYVEDDILIINMRK